MQTSIHNSTLRHFNHFIENIAFNLQNQFEEIVRKSEIPKEIGEEQMLRALDTSRMANPDIMPDVLNPKPEMPKQFKPTTEGND